jgi:AcrR family transcriptional regulator
MVQMPHKRFFDLAQERRERIFAAAANEFAEHGYGAASINRIIDAAGISKGSLYYYFEGKEDLFATTMEQAIERVLGQSGFMPPSQLSAESFWNTFREVMRRSIDYMQTDGAYIRLARSFHQLRATAPASEAARRVIDTMAGHMRAMIERGQALGVVRTDLPLPLLVEVTLAVDEAGDRWRIQEWDRFSHEEHIAHADAQIDLMRDMLHADNQGWEG